MFTQKRHTLRLVSLASAIVALTLTLSGLTAYADVPDAVVATSQLRVHTGPYLLSDVVATLTQGTQLTLDGRDQLANWLHGKASDGTVGWLSRPYLSIRNSLNIQALPVLAGQAPSSAGSGGKGSSNQRPVTVSGRLAGGFELGGQVHGLNPTTIADMQRAGMHWIKRQLYYGDGAGMGWIGEAHNLGFKILLSVVGNPPDVLQNGYFDLYANFVGGLAAGGADGIEIWNEANIDREWPTGHVDAAMYTQLLAKSYNAIKSKNASTMVISGAPSPTGYWGAGGKSANGWNDDVFYAGMAAAGAGSYADCIGIHYNEGIVSPLQTSGGWIAYPTNYFDTMLRRAMQYFPGKRGCFTELGYLTSQGYGALPGGFSWAKDVTVAEQATWLAQAAVRASASGRVRLMVVWNVNATYYGADPQAGYAIIRNDGSCPACDTLHNVSH